MMTSDLVARLKSFADWHVSCCCGNISPEAQDTYDAIDMIDTLAARVVALEAENARLREAACLLEWMTYHERPLGLHREASTDLWVVYDIATSGVYGSGDTAAVALTEARAALQPAPVSANDGKTAQVGGRINWRDDPDAIVEDDEPQIGRDYE